MRRLIVIVTNVMFAGHILLGCCLHHAHGCESTIEAAEGDCGHHHGCGHHGHHLHSCATDAQNGRHDEPTKDDDAPPPPCDHGRCSFVKCETQRVDLATAHAIWSPLVVAELQLPLGHNSLAAFDLSAAIRPGDCPLHVLYCALIV